MQVFALAKTYYRSWQVDCHYAPLTRSLLLSAHMLEPVYGFASLLRFKRKFQPEAQPIYLCYPDGLQLANIGIAVLHAYLPELSLRDIVHLVQSLGAKK